MPEAERAMAEIRDFIQHQLNEIVQRPRSDCVCFRSARGAFRTKLVELTTVKIPCGRHPRYNNMTPHIPEEFSIRLIDWSLFMITGNTIPPRDPDEEDEDEGRRGRRSRRRTAGRA